MDLLAIQPYIKVTRVVDLEQKNIVQHRQIYLYRNRIVTRYRRFPIEDVLDISFRKVGGEGGLLFLHTVQGIFSYVVETSPELFIQAFKVYIKDLR
ncbi:hypothetical protein MHB50_20805 [Siminovitchia sp. FSL H7-0308]|uniref:DUF304 domain-containing protein n=1 Tax=Siminovitchia thermophila TaxID=1245522 RepID=A0ABS2R592_9BACI|nr:hypothetical protein [Siminovitchia thermophila]MBM7714575.1 hypothetical protein [Siminovitchia thermophila]ONK22628.1 hypothetical protein BLX87_14705 [Bacillus sp. VT-16-64]